MILMNATMPGFLAAMGAEAIFLFSAVVTLAVPLITSVLPMLYAADELGRGKRTIQRLPPAIAAKVSAAWVPAEGVWREDATTVRYIQNLKWSLAVVEANMARLRDYEILLRHYEIEDVEFQKRQARGKADPIDALLFTCEKAFVRRAYGMVRHAWYKPAQATALVRQIARIYGGDALPEIRDLEDAIQKLEQERSRVDPKYSGSIHNLSNKIHAHRRDIAELTEFVSERQPKAPQRGPLDERYETEFLPRIRYTAQTKVDEAESRARAAIELVERRRKLRAEVAARFADPAEREHLYRRIDQDLGIGNDDIYAA
jgi:hypothetical protein